MNQLSISDQYPHAKNLSSKFGGRESSNRYNGHNTFTNLQCPCCSRKKAVMYVAENQSTYLLKCPRDSCQLSTAITLSNAINTYATEFVSAWNVAIGKYPTWGGIQNRRPRGKSQKNKSDGSFRAEMEKNAVRQQVKMLMQQHHENNERYRKFGDSQT